MATSQARRGDTRRRIQDVALTLFAEHGYEKTSLREIAEHLDVTKAALYYHFKTKEDILISVADDLGKPVDDLIAWAQAQPRTLATKQEILSRYSEALWGASRLFRFMQENQATMRELSIGESFKDKLGALGALLKEPDFSMTGQVRCMTALFAMHAGMFAMQNIEGDPDAKRLAILEVAQGLIADAHAERG
ncbi:helix-turn-helix domain-containing protein [Actinacidiphila oryziradicis]|jgi:AcrR family transcriptional regulator|uniref:TetR/AcrR family transcriptional regulator n=1 Tax=Actinacidiphila oryziradicis TaxID=2571141 RepID=UPI0023F1278A|nr:helix-turn-helix domain-containing protein [Actinacidiphila oryziradicis]MCW2869439.1 putative TetR-family transcriptional regulator [Actinacidiphila oryziradicis]